MKLNSTDQAGVAVRNLCKTFQSGRKALDRATARVALERGALITAAFMLVDLGMVYLAGAWRLVSTNAADAVSLTDRARIAPDQRADLPLVEWQPGRMPRLVATFVTGEVVFAAENPLRMIA